MSGPWSRIERLLAAEGRACLVTVLAVQGSAPREPGARLVVQADGRFSGTIGGGALEWQALAEAQKLLHRHPEGRGIELAQTLGPDLGQCCGGHVRLLIEVFAPVDMAWIAPLATAESAGPFATSGEREARGLWRRVIVPDPHPNPPPSGQGALWGDRTLCLDNNLLRERFGIRRTPVLLFGAGHVGRALVLALAPLPFAIRWIDARPEAFPAAFPANAVPITGSEPAGEIAAAPPGALVLALTHSHALDLEIAAAALARDDLPHVGVIGSATKAARFRSRLTALGLAPGAIARLVCPIGRSGLRSKEPAVIAAGVAVELLAAREGLALPARRQRRLA